MFDVTDVRRGFLIVQGNIDGTTVGFRYQIQSSGLKCTEQILVHLVNMKLGITSSVVPV